MELLDGHEQVTVYGEVFGGQGDVYGAPGPPFQTYRAGRALGRARPLVYDRISYLRRLYGHEAASDAVGLKLMYGQVATGLLEFFALRRVRVVHLIRGNFLDAVLSYEVAKARGLFAVREGDDVPAVKIRLDPGRLLTRLDEHEFAVTRARHAILRYRLRWLEVFYEDLVGRRDEILESILRFLDVDDVGASELSSTFVPVDDVPRREVLENFDEVHEALVRTRFAWMLADPPGAVRAGPHARR